jgi:hypothetical protein
MHDVGQLGGDALMVVAIHHNLYTDEEPGFRPGISAG